MTTYSRQLASYHQRRARGVCIVCAEKRTATKPDGTQYWRCTDCRRRHQQANHRLWNRKSTEKGLTRRRSRWTLGGADAR